jgi:RNA polymerase sigma factor (sigma-70 family)
MGFARAIAGEYLHPGVERDELYQAAYLGLTEAAWSYDVVTHPSTPFPVYAEPAVRKRLRQALCANHVIPINDSAYARGVRSPDVLPLKPQQATASDPAIARELGELVDQAFAALEPLERTVVTLRFGLGPYERHTILQTAAVLGIGRGMVSVHMVRAIRRIQAFVASKGWDEASWREAIA